MDKHAGPQGNDGKPGTAVENTLEGYEKFQNIAIRKEKGGGRIKSLASWDRKKQKNMKT